LNARARAKKAPYIICSAGRNTCFVGPRGRADRDLQPRVSYYNLYRGKPHSVIITKQTFFKSLSLNRVYNFHRCKLRISVRGGF